MKGKVAPFCEGKVDHAGKKSDYIATGVEITTESDDSCLSGGLNVFHVSDHAGNSADHANLQAKVVLLDDRETPYYLSASASAGYKFGTSFPASISAGGEFATKVSKTVIFSATLKYSKDYVKDTNDTNFRVSLSSDF